MSSFTSLLKDTAIIGFGNIFSKGIIFFLIPLQTAVMSTSDYGVAEMLFNLVNILIPIFTLGIAEAGMRFSVDVENVGKRKSVFQIITVLPVIGGIILCIFAFPAFVYYQEYQNYFSQLLLLYLCFSLREIFLQFSKGISNLKLFSFGSILFSFTLFVLSYYFLVLKNLGVTGYLNSYILANLITIVFLFYYGDLKKYFTFSLTSIDKQLLKAMIFYSLPLVSNLLAWWITNLSNRYILAYFCTLSDVGIYSALAKFSLILSTVYGVFFQSWQLNAAKNINMQGRKEFFSKVHNYFVFAVIFGSAFFMILADFIAPVFIRGNFSAAYQYLPGIVLAGTASCLPMYWGAIYGALKDTKGAFYSTLCGGAVSIVFNFWLIPKYGIYGAVVSTVVSYLVVTVYRIVDINKILNIELSLFRHILGLLILFAQAVAFIYFDDFFVLTIVNCCIVLCLTIIYYECLDVLVQFVKKRLRISIGEI